MKNRERKNTMFMNFYSNMRQLTHAVLLGIGEKCRPSSVKIVILVSSYYCSIIYTFN